jgi:hypothetical protein
MRFRRRRHASLRATASWRMDGWAQRLDPAVPVQADGVAVSRLRADGRPQLLVCVRAPCRLVALSRSWAASSWRVPRPRLLNVRLCCGEGAGWVWFEETHAWLVLSESGMHGCCQVRMAPSRSSSADPTARRIGVVSAQTAPPQRPLLLASSPQPLLNLQQAGQGPLCTRSRWSSRARCCLRTVVVGVAVLILLNC